MNNSRNRWALNKYVYVENLISGAKYWGKLSAINNIKNKFCLTGLVILNKDGEYKAVSGGEREVRWFSMEKYKFFENLEKRLLEIRLIVPTYRS